MIDLNIIHEEPEAEKLPWWVAWDVIPILCCLCIAIFTAIAIGRV